MNRQLFVAALLAALTAAIHLFAGGADVAAPLLASSLPSTPKLTLYVVWHGISVVLVFSALALFLAARPAHAAPARYLVLFISAVWCAFAALFVLVAVAQGDAAWFLRLPQWILLLPVGLLGLRAVMRQTGSEPTLQRDLK